MNFSISSDDNLYSESIVQEFNPYLSEYAFLKYQLYIEIQWLSYLCDFIWTDSDILNEITDEQQDKLQYIYDDFSEDFYSVVKKGDFKDDLCLYGIKGFTAYKLKLYGLHNLISYVGIGCCDEDIINSAYALMIDDALLKVWIPEAKQLVKQVSALARRCSDARVISLSQGKMSGISTLGKELSVFANRLALSLERVIDIWPSAKFSGSTGNYSALDFAFPNVNWETEAARFVESYLGVELNLVTSRNEPFDYMVRLFDEIRHFNNIHLALYFDLAYYLHDQKYLSLDYRVVVEGTSPAANTGRSLFEFTTESIDQSNILLMLLSNMLMENSNLPSSYNYPKTFDESFGCGLSDSSCRESINYAFITSVQAIKETSITLQRLFKADEDIDVSWKVLLEPLETILCKNGIIDAHKQIEEFFDNKSSDGEISYEDFCEFVQNNIDLTDEDKHLLLSVPTPLSYIGYASEIATDTLEEIEEDFD